MSLEILESRDFLKNRQSTTHHVRCVFLHPPRQHLLFFWQTFVHFNHCDLFDAEVVLQHVCLLVISEPVVRHRCCVEHFDHVHQITNVGCRDTPIRHEEFAHIALKAILGIFIYPEIDVVRYDPEFLLV